MSNLYIRAFLSITIASVTLPVLAKDFEVSQKDKKFTLEEAKELLPLVKRITQEAVDQVEKLKKRIEELDPEPAHKPYYEQELAQIVERWSEKPEVVGSKPTDSTN